MQLNQVKEEEETVTHKSFEHEFVLTRMLVREQPQTDEKAIPRIVLVK